MIDKASLKEFIENQLQDTDLFLVDLTIDKDNHITVEIDSDNVVDIDECVALTKEIEAAFNRDDEDYELEVGSAGITSPFKVRRQFLKNVGREVEVLTKEGKKMSGILKDAGDEAFTVIMKEKVKREGAKRPEIEEVAHTFNYGDVKQTKYLLKF